MNPVLDVLKFCLGGGFWHFIGCVIVLGLLLQVFVVVLQSLLLAIRGNGGETCNKRCKHVDN